MAVIPSATRLTIRQRVGDNVGGIIVSTASTSGTGTTLIDTYGFQQGSNDEYNGGQVRVNAVASTASSANIGVTRWVTDFTSSSKTAIISPAYSASVLIGDSYEFWKPPYDIKNVDRLIREAEDSAYPVVFVPKIDTTVYTESARYVYGIPSGFTAISRIDYCDRTREELIISDGEKVWTANANVTASVDSTLERGGKPSTKLVVAAGASSADILAYYDFSAIDLRACTHQEISVMCTVSVAASTFQALLSGTTACATPTETLNLPALTANEWKRVALSLTAQQSDSAIISVGIKMPIDPGAFTLYTRRIRAVDANSRVYEFLPPMYWKIQRDSTDYIRLDVDGLDTTGADTVLRITGYTNITAMTADSDTCQIDPVYIENYVTGKLLTAYPATAGNKERLQQKDYVALAETQRRSIATSFVPGTRII